MENLTHSLLGVALAESGPRRRLGPGATVAAVLASNVTDLDALWHFSSDPLAITYRRGPCHSVFGVPLLCLAAAWLLRRARPELPSRGLFLLCLAAAALHVFFDLVNSFGVVLFAPLWDARFELGAVFIVDPFLTAAVALPLLASLHPALKPARERCARLALAGAFLYVGLCLGARRAALGELRRWAGEADSIAVFPEPLGPHRWRGVVREGERYRLALLRPFSGELRPAGELRTALSHPAVLEARGRPEARRLEWFFKAPVWETDGGDALAWDLRFRSLALGGDAPFVFRFSGDGRVQAR